MVAVGLLGLGLGSVAQAAPAAPAAPPLTVDPALDQKAEALFRGLRDDDPAEAVQFFMPKDEFLLVKDIADPGAYWDELIAWFDDDVHRLHKELPDLAGASYSYFALGTTDVWTPIGKESNKQPYHSVRNSILAWTGPDGATHTTPIRVIIDFEGGWWITHLRWPTEGAKADLQGGK
jgi:hypothetical protein